MADSRQNIRVYSQDDTIIFHLDGEGGHKLSHTADLSTPVHFPLGYMSISDLHDAAKSDEVHALADRIVQAVQRGPVVAARNVGISTDGLLAELRSAYPPNADMKAATVAAREAFYEDYDQLRPYLRAIVEGRKDAKRVQDGISVLITRRGDLSGVGGIEKSAGSYGRGVAYLTVGALGNGTTVLEEIVHAVDDCVGKHIQEDKQVGKRVERVELDSYSSSLAWRKALRADLSKPNPLAESLYRYFETTDGGKANPAIRLPEYGTLFDRNSEALLDIMRMESLLIKRMKNDGNLTAISAEIAPTDTIDMVMNRAMPNLWALYRGPDEGMRMVQSGAASNSKISQIPQEQEITLDTPQPVTSFREACQMELDSLQSGLRVEVSQLPGPTSPVQHPVVTPEPEPPGPWKKKRGGR